MKEKIRKFLDIHPIAGVIVLYFASWTFVQPIGLVIDRLIQKFITPQYPNYIVSIICAFITLWVFKKLYSPEYEGSLIWKNTLKGILFLWPTFIALIFAITVGKWGESILVNLITAIWAGANEEIVSRGLPISYITYHYRKAKHFPLIVGITGLVFGLSHYQNLFAGGTFFGTTSQVLNAAALGMIYAAVFIRTGSLWPGIIAHFLNDFLIFMMNGADSVEASGVNSGTFNLEQFIIIVPVIIYTATAFFLIRKKKRAEIEALWDRKWNYSKEK